MAEKQQYKTTLASPGLVDMGYKGALTSKVDELLKKCNVKKVETIKKKSIDLVVTETGLRRNKGKLHNLDQRPKSPMKYKERGFLRGTTGTLEENLIPGRDYHEAYHAEQCNLFNELSNRFPGTGFLTSTKQKKDENGLWFLYRNEQKLSTTQFLNLIDKITLRYIEELRGLDVKDLPSSDIEKQERDLQTIAYSCQAIVMGRYLVDIKCNTDFMKDEETKLWRNHVAVLLSFAALLVILEMMKLRLRQNSKRNRTTNENSFPVAVFGVGVIILLASAVYVLHRRKKIKHLAFLFRKFLNFHSSP